MVEHEFTFRSATNEDALAVRALISAVLAEYGLSLDDDCVDADLNNIEQNYISTGGLFELIEDAEGNLVGTVGLLATKEGTCELRKMYLVPSVRGRGLGKITLERMLARARSLGFVRMELETSSRLVQAIKLYRSYGFEPIQTDNLSRRCDQAYGLELR